MSAQVLDTARAARLAKPKALEAVEATRLDAAQAYLCVGFECLAPDEEDEESGTKATAPDADGAAAAYRSALAVLKKAPDDENTALWFRYLAGRNLAALEAPAAAAATRPAPTAAPNAAAAPSAVSGRGDWSA